MTVFSPNEDKVVDSLHKGSWVKVNPVAALGFNQIFQHLSNFSSGRFYLILIYYVLCLH